MNNNQKPHLILSILKLIGVTLAPLAGYWLAPEIKWELSAQSIFGTAGFAIGLIVIWAFWSLEISKKVSQVERVKTAKQMDRSICGCTEIGEIMLDKIIDGKTHRVCPKCSKSYPPLSDLKIPFQ